MNGPELGVINGCTFGCMKPHYCGDGILDTNLGEQCDMGALNGVPVDANGNPTGPNTGGWVLCNTDCMISPILF